MIIALAGSREAVIGGDRRSITFLGSCPEFEEELYCGKIKNDLQLVTRAKELKASIQVSDGREKVWRRGDLLVGEVAEISSQCEKRRRIYLSPAAHVLVDIKGSEAKIIGKGNVAYIVLGNKFTQLIASEGLRQGKANEKVVRSILVEAGQRTASVSREYTVLRTDVQQLNPEAAVFMALKEDCENSGWRLCGQQ